MSLGVTDYKTRYSHEPRYAAGDDKQHFGRRLLLADQNRTATNSTSHASDTNIDLNDLKTCWDEDLDFEKRLFERKGGHNSTP